MSVQDERYSTPPRLAEGSDVAGTSGVKALKLKLKGKRKKNISETPPQKQAKAAEIVAEKQRQKAVVASKELVRNVNHFTHYATK